MKGFKTTWCSIVYDYLMSTVAHLINRTQRQLLSGVVEERNKISVALTATATTVVFSYETRGIQPGAIIEIDSELLYIWEIVSGTKTATVERGFNGTTAAAHTAGSMCIVDPRFPRNQIMEAFNDDLADLAAPVNGLYRVKSLDLNYNGSDTMINLPSIGDVIELLDVRLRYLSTDYPMIRKVGIVRNLPTSDFGSGTALKFNEPTRSGNLRITYKAPFNRIIKETDDLQINTGFPITAEDILILGAQIRLMAPREIKRNFTESQGDTRRADEVPAGAVSNSINQLQRLRRDRITAEATKLDSQYPLYLNRD
jgi:hypothetical protein